MANPDGAQDPTQSRLSLQSDHLLMVKLLVEMRVQTMLMSQAFGMSEDIAALRDEVMSQGNTSPSSL